MAFDSEGILSGLILNSVACPILLVVGYMLLRKDYLWHVEVWKIFRITRPSDPPTFYNFGGFGPIKSNVFRALFRNDDPWLEYIQGDEVNMYLQFLKFAMAMCLAVGLYSFIILVPTYSAGSYREQYLLEQNETDSPYQPGVADWTTRNVAPKSAKFWLLFVISVIVALECYGMVANLLNALQRIKAKQPPTCTVMIKGVPEKDSEAWVRETIPLRFHSAISCIEIPRKPVKGMLKAMDEQRLLLQKLEHWYAFCEKKGIEGSDRLTHKDVMVRPSLFSAKVNAITHFREEYDRCSAKLEKMQKQVDLQDVIGRAYVTMTSGLECAKYVASANKGVSKLKRTVWFAPHPHTIIWENVGIQGGPWLSCGTGALTATVFTLLALLWGTIVGFLGSMDNLAKWIPALDPIMDLNTELKDTITTYLPIIALSLLYSVIPWVMRTWTQRIQLASDKMQREVGVLQKLFWFGLVISILMQAVLQGGGDGLSVIENASGTELINIFVGMITPTNGYFVVVVMQSAFMGNIMRWLRLGAVAGPAILSPLALTQRERDALYMKRTYYISEEYSTVLIILGFVLIFCVNVPIIPIFGFFYLLIKFLTDRSLLADSFPRIRDSDVRLLPCAVNCVLALVFIFQLMGVTVLTSIKQRWDVCGFSFVPLIATVVVIVWVHKRVDYIMGTEFLEETLSQDTLNPKDVPTTAGLLSGLFDDSYPTVFLTKSLKGTDPLPAESPYRHPCKAFDGSKIDHEVMGAKSWYAGSVEQRSTKGHPFAVVNSDAFFSNPSSLASGTPQLQLTADPDWSIDDVKKDTAYTRLP